MNKYLYLSLMAVLLLTIPLLANAQSNDRVSYRIESGQLDQQRINEIELLAKKIVGGMKSGEFHILTEQEAIPVLREQFTPEAQGQAYVKVSKQLGAYPGRLKFAEAYDLPKDDGEDLVMYRFESDFELIKTEVRMIYYKEEDKLAGFYIIPWVSSI